MEKFTIRVIDNGVVVIGEKGNRLEFSAGEALMLLDILKNEEVELRKMAEEMESSWLKRIPVDFSLDFLPNHYDNTNTVS